MGHAIAGLLILAAVTTSKLSVLGTSRFLCAPDVPARPLTVAGMPSGVTLQVLREDPTVGVRTAVLTIPAGWTSPQPHAHGVSEEVYVLDGDLTVGDDRLTRDGTPTGRLVSSTGHTGRSRAPVCSSSGAATSIISSIPPPLSDAVRALVIAPIAVDRIPWINDPGKAGPSGSTFGRKLLRHDDATGDDTQYLIVPGGFEGWGAHFHDIHEELYCLDGEVGPFDGHILTKDCYLHNPAYIVHAAEERSTKGSVLFQWRGGGQWEMIFVDPVAPGGRQRPPTMGRLWDGPRP